METIKFDYSTIKPFVKEHEVKQIAPFMELAHDILRNRTGAGAEMTDWVTWPEDYDKEEFARIQTTAEKIRQDSEVLVVIGIGGSYLGAKAAIEFLNGSFYMTTSGYKGNPTVVFAGNNISGTYLTELIEFIGDRDFSINIISKSGTTTEPAIAFRILKNKLIEKYGEEEAVKRIYATTDKSRGALRQEADQMGYESFYIPDGIGGRFTVLTAVGLLPIAVAGNDIEAFMAGAQHAMKNYSTKDILNNDAYLYATIRNILHLKGKDTEILVNYEPSLKYFAEWWKQLFGESEGKDNKGILPASANFSTDLHSIGQIIQEGLRNIYETVITVKQPKYDQVIPTNEENLDGLKYIEGQTVNYVNDKAFQGTLLAHTDGQVPNMHIEIPAMDEHSFGQLIYFFEIAVAISGYFNGINPFDQPGVESYKDNMFALLGKPGYEELSEELNERLK